MKTNNGIQTAYNAQTAVDSAQQVIIAADVTDEAADVQQLLPMIDQAQENLSGAITQCSADAGYSSGENLKAVEQRQIDAYIPDCEYQAQQRKHVVEPPFGHIKSIMGFTGFMLRGLEKVKGEFKLVSTAHNLRKIWLYLKANGKTLAGMCPAPGN